MKRADIRAGQVYGHNESTTRHYHYQPVVVLSLNSYCLNRYTHVLAPDSNPSEGLTTGRSTYGSAVGLLCVMLSAEATSAEDVAKVLRVATPEAAVAGINGDGLQVFDPDVDLRVLGRYILLTRAQYLHGDYRELTDALEAREQRTRTIAQQHEEARLERLYRCNALAGRLDALDITGYHVRDYESPERFPKLSFDDMEELIELAESAVRANKAAGIGVGGTDLAEPKPFSQASEDLYDQYIREGAPGSYDAWLRARLFNK